MFAIALDLVAADAARNHRKGVSQTYADMGAALASYGFIWMQGSV